MSSAVPTDGGVLRASPFIRARVHSPVGNFCPRSLMVGQVNDRATFMARLVDSLLRGRAQPSARNEAAAAVSDVRAFVRAWRPTPTSAGTSQLLDAHQGGAAESGNAGAGEGHEESRSSNSDGGGPTAPNKPSADVLLKMAQVP